MRSYLSSISGANVVLDKNPVLSVQLKSLLEPQVFLMGPLACVKTVGAHCCLTCPATALLEEIRRVIVIVQGTLLFT
jgi:hypothetical protein